MFLTVFLMIPFALFASVIFSILYLDKSKIQNKIKNKILNKLLFILTYILIIIFFTIGLSIFGVSLMVGLLGLPVLIILDIVGIILLIRKIYIKKKSAS
jgi:hypothetical protein